jgi:hypothetical protein
LQSLVVSSFTKQNTKHRATQAGAWMAASRSEALRVSTPHDNAGGKA